MCQLEKLTKFLLDDSLICCMHVTRLQRKNDVAPLFTYVFLTWKSVHMLLSNHVYMYVFIVL